MKKDRLKVLITGATGFIGSHLVDLLLEKQYEIYCLVRKSSDLTWLKDKNITLVNFENLNNNSDFLESLDYVYHIAGQIAGKSYDDYYKSNVEFTKKLIELFYDKPNNLKRFLFMSSQTASGPAVSKNSIVDENYKANPITAYGKSKLEAEKVVLNYCDKIPVTIIKAPAVYGPRDKSTLPIFKMVDSGIKAIFGSKTKYFSSIFVSDLIEGTVLAAESEKSKNETYIINENIYTWEQTLETISKVMSKKRFLRFRIPDSLLLFLGYLSGFLGRLFNSNPVFNYEKSLDIVQDYWICSSDKIKNDLSFIPKTNLESGFEATYNWYKKNNWL